MGFLSDIWDMVPSAGDVYGSGDNPSFVQGLAREFLSPKGITTALGAFSAGNKAKEALNAQDKTFEQQKELLALKHQYDLESQAAGGGGGGGNSAAFAQIALEKKKAKLEALLRAQEMAQGAATQAGGNEISAYTKLGELAQRPLVG